MQVDLRQLASLRRQGRPTGVTSACSAHPIVIRAALRHGRQHESTVLIEATCNQVNHLGGYTGMTPDDFAALVREIAAEEGCPEKLIVLGGDHLGPNPWRDRPAEEAMAQAEKMVAAYIEAGFRKIHLDASMGCKGEPVALDDETTAQRAARLATVAETCAERAGGEMPVYIIGTEVPPPGGADHALDTIEPTSAAAALKTIDVHRRVFSDLGLDKAFGRAIGLVVQPGVEFGNHNVIHYDHSKIDALKSVLADEPQFVFEAHSTDYQGTGPLTALVADGFPILKVGPELTFVLREALYALDAIASDLLPDYGDRPLYATMEALMLSQPENWSRHYHNGERWLRHYSLSDRIRYYWAAPEAQLAVDRLCDALRGQSVPLPLFWQHMPSAQEFAGSPLDPEGVLIWRVMRSIADYHAACGVGKSH
ncbi:MULTISPECIES: class II D-tagatose-bisphosphate aldolase, non-catalytic subunit [unclassified Agrobacterium]|uniref:class II D-tagatose-bisphosphate aldolase, non-catalytic subunit n=1 Tax=unclassified Agrobacterium TaxID=2632611 RepID=UPI002447474F|nr:MULTISPECIES: class II D-tagatose-bisphosphate aldolase, non-catalytic subunit [unclassified Agrobacterium]MDH0613805.1 class II D-tagatose-bisphosphate aldolase, non-catalytic subunit [Agrobacterium sp. GD03872]MDH0696694.1 class II D-tagatose-bisphosphate aldolase, non-catalytic subunit [Agrobacterium sp. GD03871]MDH1060142.1 class II D-tagatose-bisphosphate aldolase, non-catalytic subunit [Agrobacterium sp. GD03992]MDH2210055.1 class II D-tagatose-bisphosphate aldolase, non-catalytic subu